MPTRATPTRTVANLPPPLSPFARYLPCRRNGRQIYVSGQVAALGGTLVRQGRVGDELSLEQGQQCARQCALNVLALLQQELGDLSRVREIIKVTVFVASTTDFLDHHLVADGTSSAFIEYLGERGQHARSAVGVASLPMNSPVEVEAIVLIESSVEDTLTNDGREIGQALQERWAVLVAGLRCPNCGTGETALAWRCPECGGVLELDIDRVSRSLDPLAPASKSAEGLWRYLPWLPVSQPLSLGEATTPLVSIDWHGIALTLKLEGSLPTGSFKDRGSAVMIRWLMTHGAPHVVVDSSGNAGASLAAYCARAGLACHVFVPMSAAVAKLTQISAYGAILHKVEGTREQVTEKAMAWASDGVYASHAWSALFLAGIETFAFEVWEQFSGDLPDAIVLPVGAGTLLLGAARGFASLLSSGLASQVPRIYGIQSTACAPLAKAWAQGAEEPAEVVLGSTIAEGVCTRRPPRGRQIIDAVAASGGALVAADDEALISAHSQLAERGVYAEYTSAIAAAGVSALIGDGRLSHSDRVLVPISANGLKTASNSITVKSAKGR